MSAEAPVRLEVAFIGDLACPWSRIGLSRLLALREAFPLRLRWWPFLVAPHLPPSGLSFERYLDRRYGSPGAAAVELRRIRNTGAAEGIRFAFPLIRRQPSTLLAHALVMAQEEETSRMALAMRLLDAFFAGGADIGDPAVLRRETAALGLAWPAALDAGPVRAAHSAALALGIEGVPAVLAGGRALIAGAQPPEVLRSLLEVACHPELMAPGGLTPQGRQAS